MKSLLALTILALISGCTSITYTKTKDGGTRFHYYSTKDVTFDRVVIGGVAVEGVSANASSVRKEVVNTVKEGAEVVEKVAPILLIP